MPNDASARLRVHLICNAHLDPVWLWDWREGMNEGIQTCRTMLDLMDEFPDMTFIRGESAVYEHIERHAPDVFTRIRKQIEAGRWDVVGGTYIQPDTNLPATETFCQHYEMGKRYFKDRFGVDVRVAWAADSFGHAAGLPDVMANAGIRFFAFTRPFPKTLPIDKPIFWWRGPSGAQVLSYRPTIGWYGTERHELPARLDAMVDEARTHGLNNISCFLGLGNHGGGATRRLLRDARAWAQEHPDIDVVFSGLHQFFEALDAELKSKPTDFVPVHDRELNFTLRGCYSSCARFKFQYRRAESQLIGAEQVASLVATRADSPAADLSTAWKTLLFNSFHDVLPGTSIERAMDEQLMQLGGVQHAARDVELEAVNRLAADLAIPKPVHRDDDTPDPVPFLVINPLPIAYRGPAEFEACMDYRLLYPMSADLASLKVTLRDDTSAIIASQGIANEHTAMRDVQWRRRVVANVDLPPFGYRVYQLGIDNENGVHPAPVSLDAPPRIALGELAIEAHSGSDVIRITRNGNPLFGDGIRMITVDDPHGSWGGGDKPDALPLRHTWTIQKAIVLEDGALRKRIWVQMTGGRSRAELTLSLMQGHDAVDAGVRMMWDERSARVKLVFSGCGDIGTFDVPGATIVRESGCGEVPANRWVQAKGKAGTIGFASDSISSFELTAGEFRPTIARASRYADGSTIGPDEEPWLAATDIGELKFNFLLTDKPETVPTLARQLERPIIVQTVARGAGTRSPNGALGSVEPNSVEVLAIRQGETGAITVRLRETAGLRTDAHIRIGTTTAQCALNAHAITEVTLR